MPIYEYVCKECGHALEALQKLSEAPLRDCPACEKDTLIKKISAPAFRLSGSGWYETDFKSENQKNLSKGDSADSSSPAKSDKTTSGGSAKSDKTTSGGSAKSSKTTSGGSAKSGGKEAAA